MGNSANRKEKTHQRLKISRATLEKQWDNALKTSQDVQVLGTYMGLLNDTDKALLNFEYKYGDKFKYDI